MPAFPRWNSALNARSRAPRLRAVPRAEELERRELLSAFLFKALEGPGGSSVTPFAVNNSGQIVGDFGAHGFLKDSAGYTTLDADVQGTETEAHGINDSGQIVGTFDTGSNVSGFLKDSAGYTKLYGPYTWGAGTFPYGINN